MNTFGGTDSCVTLAVTRHGGCGLCGKKIAGHIAQMKDNRWTIRSTEWQIEGVRSVGRPKRCWRDDIVGQQGAVWTRTAKDRERER